jgi:hypothetical protein
MAGVSIETGSTAAYEAPQIERRTEIGPMLIGVQIISGNIDTVPT